MWYYVTAFRVYELLTLHTTRVSGGDRKTRAFGAVLELAYGSEVPAHSQVTICIVRFTWVWAAFY